MKKVIISLLAIFVNFTLAPAQTEKQALLIIDIQDFYFPGGKSALVNPEKAAANASLLLERFRKNNELVVHVRHNAESGSGINRAVSPFQTEKVFSKDEVNCFLNTGLEKYLSENGIKKLVICGMQTHMCVEAAVRAASDMGYKCTLVHDACATRDLRFGDRTVKAEDVHAAVLATLRSYATVMGTEDFLKK